MAIDSKFLSKEVVAAKRIEEATNALAPISSFVSRHDAVESGTINVKFPKGSGSLDVDSTDYTGGSITMDAVSVPVNELSHKWEISGVELNNDITLADVDTAQLRHFLELITKRVTDVITDSNFSASAVDSSEFVKADMNKLYVESKGANKVALLGADEWVTVAPTDTNGFSLENGAFGFSKVAYVGNLDASVKGFAGGKNSIAVASGYNAKKWDALAGQERHLMIPTPVGDVLYREWADSNSGAQRAAFVMLFGAIEADVDSAVVLTDLA